MRVRLGLSVHNAAAIRMEHLTGYVGGIVRSEKYKTGRGLLPARRPGPAVYPNQTSPPHWPGKSRESAASKLAPARPRLPEFPFPSTFKRGFAARECLSRTHLRKGATTTKNRENPVDGGLTWINFLIPLKRGTPLTRSSFYVHLGLQIGLNFVPATILGKPWIEGRGDKIEFFCRLKWTSGLVL